MSVPDDVIEAIEKLRALVVAYVAITSTGDGSEKRYIEAARTVRTWLDSLDSDAGVADAPQAKGGRKWMTTGR